MSTQSPRHSRCDRRPTTQRSLENKALYYLQRHATSRANFRRVMLRKCPDAAGMIDALIARYTEAGLLNDRSFAQARTHSLRRRGASTRAIAQKLAQKGIDAATIAQSIDRSDDAEREAARALIARKRLFRDARRRDKDLATLARAGFRYALIRDITQA